MSELTYRATERYAYGFVDVRAHIPTETEWRLREAFSSIFPTEARLRGYDMELFNQTCPRGYYYAYGIITKT